MVDNSDQLGGNNGLAPAASISSTGVASSNPKEAKNSRWRLTPIFTATLAVPMFEDLTITSVIDNCAP